MIGRLKLTNFRQHRDRTFDLQGGLVVLRGANEKGKSTLLEALMYLWLGSKVLREPVADVVTYGENEKTLRVEGSFTIDGVQYEAYRAPSGAELVYGDQRVTGQTGVTQFMEKLLGAKADVIRKLMIAEQNAVRGILESDSKAGELIETLADLGIIDTLIDKVKSQLSSGPTKGAEAALGALQAAVGEEPVAPVADLNDHKFAISLREKDVAAATELYEAKLEEAELARGKLNDAAAAQAAYNATLAQETKLRAVKEPGECVYTLAEVQAAEKLEHDASAMAEAKAQKAVQWKSTEATWTGTEETAEQFVQKTADTVRDLTAQVSELKIRRATKLAMKINEKTCSFCKKDISELPEVSQINSQVDADISTIDEKIESLSKELEKASEDCKVVQSILAVHRENMRKRNAAYWEPVGETLPMAMKWIGPEISDSQSLSVSSSAMKSAMREHEAKVVQHMAAQSELLTLKYPSLVSESEIEVAKATVNASAEASAALQAKKDALAAAKSELSTAEAVYAAEMRAYEAAIQRRSKSMEDVVVAEKLLADMVFNNQLIDDLRSARAEIRRRLWDSVTAAISVYFSRIRQVETRITQSEDGFLQNGKSIGGLSGSAKDMLGLAVRAALLKTFIPGAPIMVVDEPFSGCDDDRETAGLGVLSALGFPQTILVTHSDLADSLANQLVQL